MLSICIPTYNFDLTKLVNSLLNQINSLSVDAEIILIDDCSQSEFREINKNISNKITYIQLEKNVGRAVIRNLFLNYVKYDYLLFLDCDSYVNSDDFLKNYISEIQKQESEVICGGRVYDSEKPERNKMLSWKYGREKESKPFEIRKLLPFASFMTNNFVIAKSVFEKIKFDERLSEYGHEDTLFGYNMQVSRVKIAQIENPVLNGDIELNHIFLKKTEIGILNLIQILKYVSYEFTFIECVKLLSFHKKIKNLHLENVVLFLFLITKPILKLLLKKGLINLYLFDFYKLGFLIKNYKS